MTDTLPAGLRHARTLSVLIGLLLIATGLRDLLGIYPRWDPATVTWPAAQRADSQHKMNQSAHQNKPNTRNIM